MAIKYYCGLDMLSSIDLNQNQLIKPRIENLATASEPAAGDSVTGQIYYNTNDNVLKFFNGTSWVTLAASGGGVTSITSGNSSSASSGNAITSNSSATGAVTIESFPYAGGANVGHVPSGGTAGKYLDGAASWVSITNYAGWKLDADTVTGAPLSVATGEVVKFGQGGVGGVVTTAAANSGSTGYDVKFNLDFTTLTAYSGTVETTDLIAIGDDSLTGDPVKKTTVADIIALAPQGDVEGIDAGAGIVVNDPATTTPEVAVRYDGNAANVIQSATSLEGSAIATNDIIIYSDHSDSDKVVRGLVSDLPAAATTSNWATVLSNGNTSGGTSPAISAGDDITFTATSTAIFDTNFVISAPSGSGGKLAVGNSESLVLSADLVNIDAGTTNVADFRTTGSQLFDTNSAVLTTSNSGVGSQGQSGILITGQATATVSTSGTDDDKTLVTKDYVDGLVTGGLTFKGTFRADSGLILSGGNSGSYLYQLSGSNFDPSGARVAVAVGDYYVVANTGGNFYGSGGTGTCSTTQLLDIGDSVIGVSAASANASVCSDWSIVQSDEGVTDISSTDGTASTGNAITPNSNATGSVTINVFEYDGGSNIGYVPTGGTAGTFLDGAGNWSTPTGAVSSVDEDTTDAYLGCRVDPTTGNVKVGMNIQALDDLGSSVADGDYLLVHDVTATKNFRVDIKDIISLAPQGDITKVTASTTNNLLGINVVTPDGPIPDVGLNIDGLDKQNSLADDDTLAFYNKSDDKNEKVEIGDLKTYIGAGDVTAVEASTANNRLGIAIDSGTSTGPIPKVGVDIVNQTNLTAANAVDADELLIYDSTNTTNKAITLAELHGYNSFAGTITTPTTGGDAVTHSLGSFDVIVQLYDDTTKETIYACVDRTSINEVTITFDSAPANSVRVLVTKCV
tara:strand:+ start:1812 stop:4535 length:2724 start_codon:yes stop_codon:yes gene_type:complete